jgi:hypothetical protein
MSVDSDLSDAVVLYIGYDVTNCPRLDRSRLVPKFGEVRANEFERQVKSLLAELGSIEVNWAAHDLVSGSALARDEMHTRFPELSEHALDALEWKFSYDWK